MVAATLLLKRFQNSTQRDSEGDCYEWYMASVHNIGGIDGTQTSGFMKIL